MQKTYKPEKQKLETFLDLLLVDIYLNNKQPFQLEEYLNRFEEDGYSFPKYRNILKEIKGYLV